MTGRLIITDHAVLRYLERVGGFEIDRLRANIAARLGPLLVEGVRAVKIDGHSYLIERTGDQFFLVTILPKSRLATGHVATPRGRS